MYQMFDIVARKNDIYLYGMDLYTDRPTEVFHEIYTKRGRFFENDGLAGGYRPRQNQLPGASQSLLFGFATHFLLSRDTLKILKMRHFP